MKTIDELIAEAKLARNAVDVERPGINGTTLAAAIAWNKKRHSEQWSPKNAIAFLEAFKAMREALGKSRPFVSEEVYEDSHWGLMAQNALDMTDAAMIAADRVLESL